MYNIFVIVVNIVLGSFCFNIFDNTLNYPLYSITSFNNSNFIHVNNNLNDSIFPGSNWMFLNTCTSQTTTQTTTQTTMTLFFMTQSSNIPLTMTQNIPLTIPSTTQMPFTTQFINIPPVSKIISWNWFDYTTADCFPEISADEYNTGYYAGSQNIPENCGKSATFSMNGNSVNVIYAWKTTGGDNYNELSPNAFAQLIGSDSRVTIGETVEQFKLYINDPGRVSAICTDVC